jgi:hypothetical protein
MENHKPIFYDEQRRRWRRLRWIIEVIAVVLAVILVVFTASVLHRVTLPEEAPQIGARPGLRPFQSASAKTKAPVRRQGRKRRVNALGSDTPPASYDPLRAAFYVSYDATSLASLQQHYKDLDVLIPDELFSYSADGELRGANGASGDSIQIDPKLTEWMSSVPVEFPIMPLLQNTDGTTWRIPETVAMLANPSARQTLVKNLVT